MDSPSNQDIFLQLLRCFQMLRCGQMSLKGEKARWLLKGENVFLKDLVSSVSTFFKDLNIKIVV